AGDEAARRTVPLPPIESIWRRWGSRFTACGVDASIVERLRAQIGDYSQWSRAWSAVGDDLDAFARAQLAAGHPATASAAWAQASLLHLFGGMYVVHDLDEFHTAHAKQVETYR